MGGIMVEQTGILDNIEPTKYFFLKNGRVLKNIYELTNSLTSMDDETFKHHVNNEKNDFAEWIRHVFNDEDLANQISRLKTKEAISKKINKKLSKITKADKKTGKIFEFSLKKKEKAISDYGHEKKEILDDKKIMNLSNEKTIQGKYDEAILKKVDEILLKEKEISLREQKIQEIEDRIEKRLAKQKGTNNQEAKFFSREFIQGIVIGLLISLIGSLIYIKFFY